MPAITGLAGTILGAGLGFYGTWFNARKTAEATAERERVARLFTERKKTYAAAASAFTASRNEVFGYALIDPAKRMNFEVNLQNAAEKYNTAYFDVMLVGSDDVVHQCRVANGLWLRTTRAMRMIIDYDPDDPAWTEKGKQWRKEHQNLRAAMEKLYMLMREDLGLTD